LRLARTHRATPSAEKKVPVSPTGGKAEDRALWIPVLITASVVAILASSYFLLKIYAPSLSQIPVTGIPGTPAGFVGVSLVVVVVLGLIRALLKSEPLAPVRTAFAQGVSRAFENPRIALVLAPLALALALGTWWHWQASARTPILRIEPGGFFAYYLVDADQAAKPPWRTFEIRVKVREGADEQRFHPRDARAIDIGAGESVLRWRAARESQEQEPKRRSYLGTPRLRADNVVTIRVLCRRSGTELFHAQAPISEEAFSLEPKNGFEFDKRMEDCDPI
jgi:hypothetical protein